MLWVKAFHIISIVTWFAGLFYLPRLFVYHANTKDDIGHQRFLTMEKKLYAIMTIGMILSLFFGLWLLSYYPLAALSAMAWLHTKLTFVLLLIGYHFWCGRICHIFRQNANQRSHIWYRFFNEIPAIALILIVVLAVVKPF